MRKRITRSRLTKKSQVTIPYLVREKLGLKPGDRVEFFLDKGNTVYIAQAPSMADKFFGAGKKYAKGKKVLSGRELHEEFEKGIAREVMKKMKGQ